MYNDLSFDEMISDPLVAQLRKADGVSKTDFADLMQTASRTYRESRVKAVNASQADRFYRTVGAGQLQRGGIEADPDQPSVEMLAQCALWRASGAATCCHGA
jgi:hypothetical protein